MLTLHHVSKRKKRCRSSTTSKDGDRKSQQKSGLRARESKRKSKSSGSRRPNQVGKASIDDPNIKQPDSASKGIVPKVPFRLILSGASGSGKTNVARWILDKHYRGKSGRKSFFKRIVLFSPTAKIDPVWKNIDGLADSDRIVDVTPSKLRRVLRDAEQEVETKGKERGSHILVILDDVIGETKFMNSSEFLTTFIRFRHFLGSVIVMTQSYIKIPRSSRIQATHIIMFPSQPTEVQRLYREYGPHNMTMRDFLGLVEEATSPTEDEPYPFLYIDRAAPIDQRFRRNLDMPLSVTNRNGSKISEEDEHNPKSDQEGSFNPDNSSLPVLEEKEEDERLRRVPDNSRRRKRSRGIR